MDKQMRGEQLTQKQERDFYRYRDFTFRMPGEPKDGPYPDWCV